MKSRIPSSHLLIFLSIALGGALVDLTTKSLAFELVGEPRETSPSRPVIRNVFHFTTSYNPGALWGFLRNMPFANYLFAALSLVAAGAILYWLFWRGAAADRWLTVALGFIMAGTLGNCYDRLVHHKVRDFLHFMLIDWPIFNLADSCLVAGAGILMLQAFFAELPRQGTAPATPAMSGATEHEAGVSSSP
jgi:signal peptidase II